MLPTNFRPFCTNPVAYAVAVPPFGKNAKEGHLCVGDAIVFKTSAPPGSEIWIC